MATEAIRQKYNSLSYTLMAVGEENVISQGRNQLGDTAEGLKKVTLIGAIRQPETAHQEWAEDNGRRG